MSEIITVVTGGEAVSQILAGLLDDIVMNESGARAALDINYLHNYRVAIRRARVIVGQYKEIMPGEAAAFFSSELHWLGQQTSQLRDADIYLAAIDQYRGWLPEWLEFFLQPFQDYLLLNQKNEHDKFVRTLTDARYTLFIAYWRAFTARGHADWDNLAWSLYEDLARTKIWRLYRKTVRQGRKIIHDTPASALHALRKDGKKLRYLIEFFDRFTPGQETQILTKQLRQLQTILGSHQDHDVQAAALIQFRKLYSQNETASNQTYLALGILIGHLKAKQAEARVNFEICFGNFSSKRIKREFRALCHKQKVKQNEVS